MKILLSGIGYMAGSIVDKEDSGGLIEFPLMPDIDVPQITVQANMPGYSAREIDRNVISPLRGQLMQVAGVKDIRSESRMDVLFSIPSVQILILYK